MMRLLTTLLLLCTLTSALPSPHIHDLNALSPNTTTSLPATCETGLTYCYAQLVSDLHVDNQTLLHQYCAQQYTVDAQSCHACHKFPVPLPRCWEGPGARKSVFTCAGPKKYDFAYRCKGECRAGRCVE